MSYVKKNLMQNEVVEHFAKIHWMIYIWPTMFLILGIIFFFSKLESGFGAFIGTIILLVGAVKLLKALIYSISTELAVTNKRIIAKFGFIKRDTIELKHDKVESLSVSQPILGRVFNYGTLTINGTGGVKTPIPNIDGPMEFRKKANEKAEFETN